MIMPQPFSDNANYQSEIRAILALHRLWLDGKGESAEADAVRDATDGHWELLSDAERKRIRGLSEDLNSIENELGGQTTTEMNPQAQAKLVEALECRQRGEWDRALELYRRWGKPMAPALLSYLRASIWFEAGDAEVALVFVEHAKRLEPQDGKYWGAWLSALRAADREKALIQAEKVLRAASSFDAAVVIFAANILWESTDNLSADETLPIYTRLIPILASTLDRFEKGENVAYPTVMLTFSLLAACHKNLGDTENALIYYSRGLELDPFNVGFLIDRGILLYGVTPRAITDFELAIQLGSADVWPYFYMAHYFVTNNRFEECRSICEQGLRKVAPPLIQSYLFVWLAISQHGLGYPTEMIRASFEKAIRADSSNDYARRNFAAFESALAGPAPYVGNWERPSASLLRTFGQEEARKSSALAARHELAPV
jgi:tetratricopeptide (TPR) repeat protein